MAQYLPLPDGNSVTIREGETPSDAWKRALQMYPESFATKTPEEQPKSGFMPALKAGVSSLKEDVAGLAGRAGLMDLPAAEKYIAEQKAYQKKTFAPTQEGFLEAPLTKIGELAGGSLPYMVAPAAAAFLAPEGLAAAGAAGLASAGQFTGSNITRQMETGKKLGETDIGAAALAAIPQAALDTVSLGMIPGMGKMFGKLGFNLSEKAAQDLAKEGLKKTVADYALTTGRTMGVEGLTEAGQQVFERMQAGLNINDPEARKEYFDNFIGGAVLGGILAPVGRRVERGAEQGRFDTQQREEQKTQAAAAKAEQDRLDAATLATKQTPEYATQAKQAYLDAEAYKTSLEAKIHKAAKGQKLDEDQKQDNREINQALKEHADVLKEANKEFRLYRQFLPKEPAPPLGEDTTQLQQRDMFGNLPVPKAPELNLEGKPLERAAPEAAPQEQADPRQQTRMLEQLVAQYQNQLQDASPQEIIALAPQYDQANAALVEARKAVEAMPKPVEAQLAKLHQKLGVAKEKGDVPAAAKLSQSILELEQQAVPVTQQAFEMQPFKSTATGAAPGVSARMRLQGVAPQVNLGVEEQEADLAAQQAQAEAQYRAQGEDNARINRLYPETSALQRMAQRPAGAISTSPQFEMFGEEPQTGASAAIGETVKSLTGAPSLKQQRAMTAEGEELPTAPQAKAPQPVQRGGPAPFNLYARQEGTAEPITAESLRQRVYDLQGRDDLSDEAYAFLRRANANIGDKDTAIGNEASLHTMLDEQLGKIERGEEGVHAEGAPTKPLETTPRGGAGEGAMAEALRESGAVLPSTVTSLPGSITNPTAVKTVKSEFNSKKYNLSSSDAAKALANAKRAKYEEGVAAGLSKAKAASNARLVTQDETEIYQRGLTNPETSAVNVQGRAKTAPLTIEDVEARALVRAKREKYDRLVAAWTDKNGVFQKGKSAVEAARQASSVTPAELTQSLKDNANNRAVTTSGVLRGPTTYAKPLSLPRELETHLRVKEELAQEQDKQLQLFSEEALPSKALLRATPATFQRFLDSKTVQELREREQEIKDQSKQLEEANKVSASISELQQQVKELTSRYEMTQTAKSILANNAAVETALAKYGKLQSDPYFLSVLQLDVASKSEEHSRLEADIAALTKMVGALPKQIETTRAVIYKEAGKAGTPSEALKANKVKIEILQRQQKVLTDSLNKLENLRNTAASVKAATDHIDTMMAVVAARRVLDSMRGREVSREQVVKAQTDLHTAVLARRAAEANSKAKDQMRDVRDRSYATSRKRQELSEQRTKAFNVLSQLPATQYRALTTEERGIVETVSPDEIKEALKYERQLAGMNVLSLKQELGILDKASRELEIKIKEAKAKSQGYLAPGQDLTMYGKIGSVFTKPAFVGVEGFIKQQAELADKRDMLETELSRKEAAMTPISKGARGEAAPREVASTRAGEQAEIDAVIEATQEADNVRQNIAALEALYKEELDAGHPKKAQAVAQDIIKARAELVEAEKNMGRSQRRYAAQRKVAGEPSKLRTGTQESKAVAGVTKQTITEQRVEPKISTEEIISSANKMAAEKIAAGKPLTKKEVAALTLKQKDELQKAAFDRVQTTSSQVADAQARVNALEQAIVDHAAGKRSTPPNTIAVKKAQDDLAAYKKSNQIARQQAGLLEDVGQMTKAEQKAEAVPEIKGDELSKAVEDIYSERVETGEENIAPAVEEVIIPKKTAPIVSATVKKTAKENPKLSQQDIDDAVAAKGRQIDKKYGTEMDTSSPYHGKTYAEAAHIAAEKARNPLSKKLFNILAEVLDNAYSDDMHGRVYVTSKKGIEKLADGKERPVAGHYNPSQNYVLTISTAGSPHATRILLHELLHAATSRGLYTNNAFNARVEHLKNTVEKWLQTPEGKKYFRANKVALVGFSNKGVYGLTNTHEFLAETFSHKGFQDLLDQIPSETPNKSVLSRLVDVFAGFFRFSKPKERSLLNDALEITEEAFAENKPLNEMQRWQKTRETNEVLNAPDYMSDDALTKLAKKTVAQDKTWKERAGSHIGLKLEMDAVDMRAGVIKALNNAVEDPRTMGSTKLFRQAIFSITAADQSMATTQMSLSVGPPKMRKDEKGYYTVASSMENDAGQVFDAVQDIPNSYGDVQAKMGLSSVYMIAQRALNKGLKKLDIGALGVTEQELQDAMAAANADPKLKAALENVRKKYNAYNRGMIEWLSSPQVAAISQADAKAYLKDEDYVPYYRVRADGTAELVFGGEKTITIGDIRHQPYLAELKGGEAQIMPLDKSIMRNTMLLVTKGMNNMAMKNVGYAMQAAGEGLGPIGKNGKPTNLMPILPGKGPDQANVIRWTQEPDPNKPDDKGDRYLRVETNDTLFGGIPAELIVKSLDGAHLTLPAFLKWGGIAGDLLRSGITRTPIYLARQLFRDPFAATATSGLDYGPITAIFKANKEFLKIAAGKSETGAKMIEKGLLQSGMFEGDVANMSKIALQLAGGKSQGVIDSMLARADRWALQADAATRALIYDNAIKNGLSEAEADHAVRESMNFSKRGLSPTVQYASRMIPFFNAQIQGLSVLVKAATGNMPAEDVLKIKRKFANNAMMLTGFGLAYAMAMDDDDYYKNAKPKDRYSNFFVPLPGVDEPLKLPIPYEFGFFFSAGVALADAIKGEVDTPQQLRAIKDMFVGAIPGASSNFVPQLVKPLAEVYANKNFFSGTPLESARLEKLSPEARYNAHTTEVAKWMATMVPGLSPIQIEHIVTGYLGQVPLMVLASTNEMFRDGKEEPTRKLSEMPLIGSSFQRKYGGEEADVVYKLANDSMEAKRTFDNYRKTGKIAEAKDFLADNRAEIMVAPMAAQYQKIMGAMRKQEEIIRGSNMPSDAKAKRIDQLDQQRQLQSERYLKAIKRAEAAGGRTTPQ